MRGRSINLKHYFLKEINPVIRFLILSDLILTGAAGLLGPIFAIFIEDFIEGGNAAVAGVSAGVYLFSKSLLQIPIAHLIDRIQGEKDDFWFMFLFTVLIAMTPILYLFISTPLELYLVQFFLGLCTAFTFPTFMAIFTRHIDKHMEGTEWGVYFTVTDISSAGMALVGGYIAVSSGFPILITILTILSLFGALALLPLKPYIRIR